MIPQMTVVADLTRSENELNQVMQWETATPVGFPACMSSGVKIEGRGESAGCMSYTIRAGGG